MPRILIVEDDRDVRDTLVSLLHDEGYQTAETSTLEDAFALLDSTTFDLIITDLLTHDQEHPLASASLLRARGAPTPVAVLSGWTAAGQSPEAADFAFVMAKPFDLEVLLTTIAAALQQHKVFSSDEEKRAQVVQQYFAALSTSDWDTLVGLCADDVTYVLPGNDPLSATVEGKSAFHAYAEAVFAQFPAARFEHVSIYATPGGMAARYQARWLGTDNVEQIQAGAVVFQFTGLQIQRIGVRLATDRLRRRMENTVNSPSEE
jgi:CheY-like chemotaxis protein